MPHLELGRRVSPLSCLRPPPLDAVEELPHGPRDDAQLVRRHLRQLEARAHRVRLAAARLPVSQHRRVVTERGGKEKVGLVAAKYRGK